MSYELRVTSLVAEALEATNYEFVNEYYPQNKLKQLDDRISPAGVPVPQGTLREGQRSRMVGTGLEVSAQEEDRISPSSRVTKGEVYFLILILFNFVAASQSHSVKKSGGGT